MSESTSLINNLGLMVDEATNRWYRSKEKSEREQIRHELRSYLKSRRISEQDKDPELAVLRQKRETTARKLSEIQSLLVELTTELQAWDARISELEGKEHKEKVKQVRETHEAKIIRYYREEIASGKIPEKRIRDGEYHEMIQADHELRFGKDAPLTAGMALMKAAKVIR